MLTVRSSHGTKTQTYAGRWVTHDVYVCSWEGGTWHAEFTADGALTGMERQVSSGKETDDATVLGWKRTIAEHWTDTVVRSTCDLCVFVMFAFERVDVSAS